MIALALIATAAAICAVLALAVTIRADTGILDEAPGAERI